MMTVREAAIALRLSLASVYLLVETGRLAHHRVGARRGAIRIHEADLAVYLAACRKERAEEHPAPPPLALPRLKHIKLT